MRIDERLAGGDGPIVSYITNAILKPTSFSKVK